ncbi:SDR family NAD(P)-dependent oxidoreductase [Microbacterium rhizomatis]|uniref:SDR family oxidoreductase n=1 Tax=Microbacterium rhizomatis TaxID=1631477 RepID=A0A5J5J152_9MICO|nr:SDR family oxidoreductase [Microbacterium rhizomatis]KAA9106579.1 SDR family oxidoreductase [Microbacterium rhizomatis]
MVNDDPKISDARASTGPRMLDGRRFLVTGGARGIGAAIVETLAAHGAEGAIIDLAAPASPSPWPFAHADVTDGDAMDAAVRALSTDGPFDGLVAAAGIVPAWHSPADIDLDDFTRTMSVNVRGVVAAIKSVAADMPPGSTIVAIGSLNSWKGDPNLLSYVASKHAVLGVVRSTALALGPRGIRANAVAPGPVATDALLSRIDSRVTVTGLERDAALERSAAATALGRLATAQDVADAVLFLSSPLSAAISGHLLPVDGGML